MSMGSKHDPQWGDHRDHRSTASGRAKTCTPQESEHAAGVVFWWFVGFMVLVYLFNL